jgi:hypothetical protein
VTALTLRLVFHLALRQVEGFVSSLLRLLGLGLPIPPRRTASSSGPGDEAWQRWEEAVRRIREVGRRQ